MASKSKPPKERDGLLSALNVAIEALNLAKEISSITPAKAVFGSASVLLTMIRDSVANEADFVDLGLFCAEVCEALDDGLKGKRLDEIAQSVFRAIEKLTTTVANIQGRVIKLGKRNPASRLFHAKSDKEALAAWRQELNSVLHIFNTKLLISNNMLIADMHRRKADREGADGQHSTQASIPVGEAPPPPPRACFGREELIQEIVDLVENLDPIALIGPGGIGKTSIALRVLHHDRVKERFGDNRWFLRCDEFPPSRANLLRRLSKVIGAGVENPEDLSPLRPSLTSEDILIIFDNGESILDPQGDHAKEIYGIVEELSQFSNVCLLITSRITTVPPDCETVEVPTLSMKAAHDTFDRIYKRGRQADLVDDILKQLDFHPLSVTLLATAAHQNKWDNSRLAREWKERQTGVLHAQHKSLEATIELSLSSPTFRDLGPDARELLGVIAFFPQGINEENLPWIFPSIANSSHILDKFCVLSLTYRHDGFTTMLAPLRDYLSPHDLKSSPLLCATKDRYFSRISVEVDPQTSEFESTRWVASEDANVEHLLDAFTSIDANSDKVWDACADFFDHLYWHKPRMNVLGPRIEGLSNDHPSKPECLYRLSRLFDGMGNQTERKRLLVHCLDLERERRDDVRVANILLNLAETNRNLGLYREGIEQAKEALGFCERLCGVVDQARCLDSLSRLFQADGQLDAAEEAASRAITLLPHKGKEHDSCQIHRTLGRIYHFKGDTEKAIHHFGTAIQIASAFNWQDELFWNHDGLAQLFCREGKFKDAQAHIEQAKLHAVGDPYKLSRAAEMQARIWYHQHQLEEATSEALGALRAFEKLGAAVDVESCRELLQRIEQAAKSRPAGSDAPTITPDQ